MSNLSAITLAKAIVVLMLGLGTVSMSGPSNMKASNIPPLYREYIPNADNLFRMEDLYITEHRTYEFALAVGFSNQEEKADIGKRFGVLNPRNPVEAGLVIDAKINLTSFDKIDSFSISFEKKTKGVNISGADFLARSIGYAKLKPGRYKFDIIFNSNIEAFKDDKVSIFVLYDPKTMSEN